MSMGDVQGNENEIEGCPTKVSSLKSFFLGPQSENAYWVQTVMGNIFAQWFDWRNRLHPEDGRAISELDQQSDEFKQNKSKMISLVREVLGRFESEIPKFSPRYVGHMASEISLPALFGHIITLLHNPNNVSGEASTVGVEFEHETIEGLLKLVGFEGGYGHFTSGGTIANYEGVARAKSRMQYWLAMGAILNTKHGFSMSFFEAAHMGWEQFHGFLETYAVGQDDMNSWLLWDDSQLAAIEGYRSAFGDYKEPIIMAPMTMHYSWNKGAKYFAFGQGNLWGIDLDKSGRLDVNDLNKKINKAKMNNQPILMVVSVCGTTEFGGIDPIDEVSQLLGDCKDSQQHIWHHVDAAYGGFFLTMIRQRGASSWVSSPSLSLSTNEALKNVFKCQSITIDPHKLAYVPYSSGCFLVSDPREYKMHVDNVAYLDFSSQSKTRGQFTLEGSRSAAGAVATWLTAKSIGLYSDGYGKIVERTVLSRRLLEEKLLELSDEIKLVPDLETNILCFSLARTGESLSAANRKSLKVYEKFSNRQESPEFYFSKTTITLEKSAQMFNHLVQQWELLPDADELKLVRLCVMNPFFYSRESRVNYADLLLESLRACLRDM